MKSKLNWMFSARKHLPQVMSAAIPLLFVACGGDPEGEPSPTPAADTTPTPPPFDETEALIIEGGPVSGVWEGSVQINNAIQLEPGQSLQIKAGTVVLFDLDATFAVDGSLQIEGSADERVWFGPLESNWPGMSLNGQLNATHFDLMYASTAVDSRAGSELSLTETKVIDPDTSFKLANGALFDRVTVEGGNTIRVTGGVFSMIDTRIDLKVPVTGSDCINVSGGGLELTYSHLTGCHCTTHVVYAPLGVTIDSSILDGNSYPMMVSDALVSLTHNNLIAGQYNIQDIGGGISAEVSGNYWGGGAPHIDSTDLGQFSGLEDYATTPFEDVGPR